VADTEDRSCGHAERIGVVRSAVSAALAKRVATRDVAVGHCAADPLGEGLEARSPCLERITFVPRDPLSRWSRHRARAGLRSASATSPSAGTVIIHKSHPARCRDEPFASDAQLVSDATQRTRVTAWHSFPGRRCQPASFAVSLAKTLDDFSHYASVPASPSAPSALSRAW